MAGFMEGYGVKEARRGRFLLRIALSIVTVAVVVTAGYFYFRTWNEERVFSQFKDILANKDYETGYRMWCTAEKPCLYYPLDKFMADWGPQGKYANLGRASIRHIDYC